MDKLFAWVAGIAVGLTVSRWVATWVYHEQIPAAMRIGMAVLGCAICVPISLWLVGKYGMPGSPPKKQD